MRLHKQSTNEDPTELNIKMTPMLRGAMYLFYKIVANVVTFLT